MQPTASRADLLLECSYPFAPDRIVEGSSSTEAQRYGIAFHAAIAELLKVGPEKAELDALTALDDAARKHVVASHSRLEGWLLDNYWVGRCRRHVEVSLAYCPRNATARLCEPPSVEDHIYPDLRQDEIGGTADLIVVPSDKARPLLVLDHKTGMWGDFARPERLPQLLVLGAAACLKWGRAEFVPAILHSPRDGLPIVYEGEAMLSPGSIPFNHKLRLAMARVGDGSLRPGSHCGRCPVRSQCPAHSADLLKEAGSLVERATLVGSELVLVANTNGALTREEKIGRLHLLLSRFRELDSRAVQEMKMALVNEPGLEPVRPDGKTLGLKTRTVERLSKASIERALGKERGAAMIEKLRKLGCLEEKEEVVLVAD